MITVSSYIMALRTLGSRSWASEARKYLESLDPFSYDEPLVGRNIRLVQLVKAEAEAGRLILKSKFSKILKRED